MVERYREYKERRCIMKQNLFKRLLLIVVSWLVYGNGLAALGVDFGEPGQLPPVWNASVDSTNCGEVGRLQAFLEKMTQSSDHTAQEHMLVSVAYIQGQRLFAALIDIIDILDNDVMWWIAQREHPLLYRLKQAPWYWKKGRAAVECEIDGYITLLKQKRCYYASVLGELTNAMHAVYDACVVQPIDQIKDHLRVLIDKEYALVTPGDQQALPVNADISVVSARVIETMSKSVHFKKIALNSIHSLNIPGHWKRNVSAYVGGGIALLALGICAYAHKDALIGLKTKVVEQVAQWTQNFKKKFKNLKDAFYSKPKGADELENFVSDLHEENRQAASLLEKDSIACLMDAYPDLPEDKARERFLQARADHALMALFDECSQVLDKKYIDKGMGKVLGDIALQRKQKGDQANRWFQSGKLWKKLLPKGCRETVTKGIVDCTAIVDQVPRLVTPIKDYLPKQKKALMALVYAKLEPIMRLVEVAGNKIVSLDQQHIRSNALTSAFISLLPEAVMATGTVILGGIGSGVGYRWLTSQTQWLLNMREALVRVRSLLDHSGIDRMTEAERHGMIIHALYHLKKQARGIPSTDTKRFEADLLFLQRSDISDDLKVQRIDSFLGPYRFLKV
jgi:hypothetical protein